MTSTTRRSSLLGVLLACACPAPASTDTDATASTGCDAECGETGTTGEDASTSDTGDDVTTGEGTTTTGAEETTTTGEVMPSCAPIPGLPPPFEVDGVPHVLLDLQSVEAELVFNTATHEVRGAAVVDFTAGSVEGFPLFDLRQSITRAELDGEELPLDTLVRVGLPAGDTTMIAIQRVLEPCSEHTLEVEYTVEKLENGPFVLETDAIAWSTALYDFPSQRLAEKWFPSNLIHDVHVLSVDLLLEDAILPHKVLANGPVVELEPDHWQIEYVDATSMSPMIQLCPAGSAINEIAEVVLDGDTVEIEAWNCTSWTNFAPDISEIVPKVEAAMQYSYGELGPYPHGERFIAVIFEGNGYSMEYPGATVTESFAIGHEVFHNWIGRGVRPLTQRDAWFDEAWTEYAATDAYMTEAIDLSAEPVKLAGDNLWVRTFPVAAYSIGAQVFARIAAEIGQDDLRTILRDFYAAYAGEAISTETLERELHCRIGGQLVLPLFHRFIYGRDGSAPAPQAGYCDDVRL